MTPKEKAEELVNKYLMNTPVGFYIDDAKECALITVEEMLKEPRMFDSEQVKYSDGSYARSYYKVPNKFWQQVKHEIEKL
jgi:hypothetical protein